MQRVRFEGYGPGGAVLMIDCLTSDRECTAATLRKALEHFGGRLGAENSVAYLFNAVGVLRYGKAEAGSRLRELAYDAGAEDVVSGADGDVDVLTAPDDLDRVAAALGAHGLPPESAVVTSRAARNVRLTGESAADMNELVAALRRIDEVRNVYSNVEIPH